MVSTPLGHPELSVTMLTPKVDVRAISELQSSFRITFAIALACFAFVAIFVPERPDQLASICEKHYSVIACQVW